MSGIHGQNLPAMVAILDIRIIHRRKISKHLARNKPLIYKAGKIAERILEDLKHQVAANPTLRAIGRLYETPLWQKPVFPPEAQGRREKNRNSKGIRICSRRRPVSAIFALPSGIFFAVAQQPHIS